MNGGVQGTITAIVISVIAIIPIIANITVIVDWFAKIISHIKRLILKYKTEISVERNNTLNNIPSSIFFIGRDEQKNRITQSLSDYPITAIIGRGGIGKTALALNVIQEIMEDGVQKKKKSTKFDAYVWVTSKDMVIDVDDILDTIARVLDYPYITQLPHEEKLQECIKVLCIKKILLVIDNFETINDSRISVFFNSLPQNNRVLITTRYRFDWKTHYNPVDLDSLGEKDGRALLEHELNRLDIHIDDKQYKQNIHSLYIATGGSPLAIKWAVGQMKVKGSSLSKLISFLDRAEGDIFKIMFASSWKLLTKNERKVIFCMLNFAAPVPRLALEAASGLIPDKFDEALGRLVWLSMLDINNELSEEKQYLSMHPLTKSFIKKELDITKKHKVYKENEVSLRIAEYYLSFITNMINCESIQKGYDELEKELQNIIKTFNDISIYSACNEDNTPYDDIIIRMGNALSVFLWSRGYWGYRIKVGEQVIESSNRLTDCESGGRHAYFIGIVYFWQGNYTDAKKWHSVSERLMEMTGSISDMALSKRLAALISVGDRKFEQAISLFAEVLETITNISIDNKEDVAIFADWVAKGENGYKAGLVSILQEIGITYNRKKDFKMSLSWLEKSLALAIEIEDIEGQSVSYSHIGHALYGLSKVHKAHKAYRKGLVLAQEVQRKSTIARCAQGLAYVYNRPFTQRQSRKYAAIAIDLFERLGMQEEYNDIRTIIKKL